MNGQLPIRRSTADAQVDNPSEIFLKCQEEVQAISCATLFSPVLRQEAVQAMSELFLSFDEKHLFLCLTHFLFLVLVSGWSDNGWLSGGHAVRMAMEICKQFAD